jgi:hypothetical protein
MTIKEINRNSISEYIISAHENRSKITSLDELMFKKEDASENLKLINKCLEVLNYIDTLNKFMNKNFRIDALTIEGKMAQIDKALTENNRKAEKLILETSLDSYKSIAFLTDEAGLNEALADLNKMAEIITDSKTDLEQATIKLQEVKNLNDKAKVLINEYDDIKEKSFDYLNDRRHMSAREIESSEMLLSSLGIVDETKLKRDLDYMKNDYDGTISDIELITFDLVLK